MKQYTVKYKLHQYGEVKTAVVTAMNKSNAYYKSKYEVIPEREGEQVYSLWVHAVTHQNGNYQTFNTFEGKPL